MAATDLDKASTERAVATSVVVVALLGMTIGNHQGHVEDIFLVGLAGLMALMLVVDSLTQRVPK